jgi:hypothetical protein
MVVAIIILLLYWNPEKNGEHYSSGIGNSLSESVQRGPSWVVDEWMAGNLQTMLSPLSSGIVILQIALRASK